MITEIKTEFRKYRNVVFLVFAFFMTATFAFFAAGGMGKTSAVVSTAGFNPGNIISDAVMSNYNSMSVADIQNFLTSKNPCKNTNYSYYQQISAASPTVKWHWENGHFVCLSEERFGKNDNEIGSGQTAAEIIYEAAQYYRINPQVLLVLLEKETSLITDPIPNDYNYRRATGYGCPDTAACSSKYYGFYNQIWNAAWLFRYTLDNGYSGYPEKTRGVRVGYHPNSACGSTEVYIENRATAALYRYTPYQPNAASLAAGYGTGDSCSSYGNRNFYLYFNNWFGSTQLSVNGELTTIPDGVYSFASKVDSTKIIDIAAGSISDYTNLQIWNRDTSQAHTWKIQRDTGTGYYTIADVRTGKLLSVADKSVVNGTNVVLSSATNDCRGKWKIYETPDHYLSFESVCASSMMLDNAGGGFWDGNNVQMWQAHTEDAEKWSIYVGKTIENGVYTVASASDSTKRLDNAGGAAWDGNNVHLWENNYAGAQKWRVEYNAAWDAYTFLNPQSGRRLDLAGEQTHLGNNIGIWRPAEACSQYWKILEVGGSYMILSTCSPSRALDLYGGVTNNGTNIQLWEVNDTKAQRWTFNNQQVISDGNYTVLTKVDQNYAVDLAGGLDYDANNIGVYESNHVPSAQLWKLRYNANTGDYTLLNQVGGRSVDVSGGNTAPGTNIQLWTNNSTCSQRWTMVKNSDTTYTLISTCNQERALDLAWGIASNASNIQLWSLNWDNSQRWYFIAN